MCVIKSANASQGFQSLSLSCRCLVIVLSLSCRCLVLVLPLSCLCLVIVLVVVLGLLPLSCHCHWETTGLLKGKNKHQIFSSMIVECAKRDIERLQLVVAAPALSKALRHDL
jgi:hypothetical protein